MPPRATPTARQQRLGAELRKLREQAGLSVVEAGKALGADRTRISNIEAGRLGLSAERIRALAAVYACPDPALVDALVMMAGERGKGWWEECRGTLPTSLLDLAELEYRALALTYMQVIYVPGLLQTEEYARAVFRLAVPELAQIDVRRRVSFRMQRKCVMERGGGATPTKFIVHEAALRMLYADAGTHRRQLERLIEFGEQSSITIRVIPFSAGGYPGANSFAAHAAGAVPSLDTVQIDAAHGSLFLHSETHLENYRGIFRRAEEAALDPEDSRDFIDKVAGEL
ncbi:helix-turn-helix domain-containing protein [Streptomyces sp. NPDC001262]|uniref:helix-turn-helix domain-containing protein n=1 Tax=unclassified Streptomyces TaxID=2593676 RepID=UPI0036C3D001